MYSYEIVSIDFAIQNKIRGLLTHAFLILKSRRDWYASYRILEDSLTFSPCSTAYFDNLFDGIRSGASTDEVDGQAGRRKGKTPVGEAWLFEETKSQSIPAILKKV